METQAPEKESLFEPSTPANQRLRRNVAPNDWKNPRPAGRYNLVVIGAGTGGLVTAAGAAGLGGRVAMVERHALGGDCLNVGCVPSKALLAAAKRAAAGRRASEYGLNFGGGPQIDFSAVMERMRELRAEISTNDSVKRFSDLGIDVFLGDGRFKDGSTLEVQGVELSFAKAVVATGARADLPPIEGLSEAKPLTNETLFSLTELPPRLVVIGGGPIGCEMGQAFARLGSRVTILQSGNRILSHDDAEAAEVVRAALLEDGVEVICEASILKVEMTDGGSRIIFKRSGKVETVECDRVLVAAGRTPNVEGLGLEKAGVKFDLRDGIEVDEHLRTSNKRIFAVGDVCLKHKFTHTADASARIVIQNALFMGRKKHTDLLVPWCTYTSPELAQVGMNEKEARDAHGTGLQVFRQAFDEVDRSIMEGEAEGFVKVYAIKGKIVGATIVGHGAGEMISEVSVAMHAGMNLSELGSVIHPYPTATEAIKKLGDAYNRTRLTPFIKKQFTRWLAWTR